MKYILKFLLAIPQALIASFVLMHAWGWFIAPKFGLPRLSLVDGVGLMFVWGLFLIPLALHSVKADWMRKHPGEDSTTYDIMSSVVTMVIVYPICLLSAYIWHQFQ